MKYYIIAGEASGDLHGANLILALKQQDPEAEFHFWGGDKMQIAASERGFLAKHYKDLAFMGFWEVAMNIRIIMRNFRLCEQELLDYQPDVLVLIDYPGFNLRIAEFAHKHNIKVAWYISPQLWAWKAGRVKKIKAFVDRMFVIFPFEKEWYDERGYKVEFVGHPLLDELTGRIKNEEFRIKNGFDDNRVIALLPGSRKQEISKMLPVYLEMVDEFSEYQFVIAGLSHLGQDFYADFIGNKDVKVVFDQTYDVLDSAHAAIVTSGTATMETALFEVPQVVCYKGSWLSYQIGKRLVQVKFIAMVNLVLDKLGVTELIQTDFTVDRLKQEVQLLLDDANRHKIKQDYALLKEKLGGAGASEKTARGIIDLAQTFTQRR